VPPPAPDAAPPDAASPDAASPDAASPDALSPDAAGAADATATAADAGPSPAPWDGWALARESEPARTVVSDAAGVWLAVFTDGARTIRLRGPTRTFAEASTPHAVIHDTWVRALDEPFDPLVEIDLAWLFALLASTEPDALEIARQYFAGMPPIMDGTLQIAGDANYGPLVDGVRKEGADFNDYLGLDWSYPSGSVDLNETAELLSVDCSGYMRLIWGYRLGLPMAAGLDGGGVAIPRRAWTQLASAPGIVVIPDTGVRPPLTKVAIGDLLFWNADPDDGPAVDHVGMFLGVDTGGNYRFVSSRKTPNGPTLGDTGGTSRLNGTGLYGTTFRATRRL
jgi:hypothetical protein